MNLSRKRRALLGCLLAVCAAACSGLLYRWDNKYTAALPGWYGGCVLTDAQTPGFLVDGWEFYPGELLGPDDFAAGRTAEQYTYAGEYANFSDLLGSPFGVATYRLTLVYDGTDSQLALYLPELLCAGRVYIGGQLAQEDGFAVLSVQDNGAGIRPEDLPHLFNQGFTRRADGSGEGLGLFIVRAVALAHNGTVEAASEPGRGSVFTLRLPLIPPEA